MRSTDEALPVQSYTSLLLIKIQYLIKNGNGNLSSEKNANT